MKVLITGGLGFIGISLAQAILAHEGLTDSSGSFGPVDSVVLFDLPNAGAHRQLPDDPRLTVVSGDITDPDSLLAVMDRPDISIFHLAGVFSAGCEQDFDRGMRVNIDGTRNVFEACRRLESCPKVVFASSGAVYAELGPYEVATDQTKAIPSLTYGMTKVVGELLLNDYTRRGFLNGRGLRLPSVLIRPDEDQPGLFLFTSSMFRERLTGQTCVLPIGLDSVFRVAGYRTTAKCLLRLHEVDGDALGRDRTVNAPVLYVTLREMVEALDQVAVGRPLGSVEVSIDPEIERHYSQIPRVISGDRARRLGLPQDVSMQRIVQEFIQDHYSNYDQDRSTTGRVQPNA